MNKEEKAKYNRAYYFANKEKAKAWSAAQYAIKRKKALNDKIFNFCGKVEEIKTNPIFLVTLKDVRCLELNCYWDKRVFIDSKDNLPLIEKGDFLYFKGSIDIKDKYDFSKDIPRIEWKNQSNFGIKCIKDYIVKLFKKII